MSFYYKMVVAFAILLTIIILFIFSANSIDNNSKISIYVIIIVMIIIAYLIYKDYSGVKEGFTVITEKSSSVVGVNLSNLISKTDLNKYKVETEKYINNLILSLLNANIAENVKTSLTYIKILLLVSLAGLKILSITNTGSLGSDTTYRLVEQAPNGDISEK